MTREEEYWAAACKISKYNMFVQEKVSKQFVAILFCSVRIRNVTWPGGLWPVPKLNKSLGDGQIFPHLRFQGHFYRESLIKKKYVTTVSMLYN